jgi:hypothetical protein
MSKKSQKTGNFHYNSSTLYIANKTTGHYNIISNIKWAALKTQGPRGSNPPLVQAHKKLDEVITVISAKEKSTYNYLKHL